MNKLYISIAALFLLSCGDTTNNKLIIGSWTGAEWLIDGKESGRQVRQTHFTFGENGEYSFNYPGTNEKGTYKVENTMLFTKAQDRAEIMVNITKLTPDSMVFSMNRSGTTEVLTLLKDK